MQVALIQLNPIIGDFQYNIGQIRQWAEKARQQGCQLAVFPELAVSGYPPQDLLERPAFLSEHQKALITLVDQVRGIGVLCGAVTKNGKNGGKPLHNSGVLFEDGEILFTMHIRLLPTYDVFDETRYFEPGRGNSIFSYKGLNLGITICEDIWNDKNVFPRQIYSIDPVSALLADSRKPIDLLINIAASPFNIGKSKLKRQIFANLCHKYGLPLFYVNQVGGQDSLVFDGGSLAMDKNGGIIARAETFRPHMVIVDTADRGTEATSAAEADHEVDAVYHALVLGTRDYVTKCGFRKVVIGLSGGIDSALVTAVAVRALGPDNVLGVALPSPYTSKESLEDAKQLAENLAVDFTVIPINDIFASYIKTIEPLFERLPADVTEQNIQARIRGNLLMALANKQGRLVLSTGNKSEMAVGYCTLYGDMSGGLAVIADVPKMLVYELARRINRDREIIPVRIIEKPPSAELAPGQKDEDDLPPYEMLDPILTAYLEDNLSIKEIIARGFAQETVLDVVRRIRLNEYKRKQAPVGLKVTTKAFGYGRRYPTAENFQEEAM